jgi:hypothetical protein
MISTTDNIPRKAIVTPSTRNIINFLSIQKRKNGQCISTRVEPVCMADQGSSAMQPAGRDDGSASFSPLGRVQLWIDPQ